MTLRTAPHIFPIAPLLTDRFDPPTHFLVEESGAASPGWPKTNRHAPFTT
jgi:hypothetical protein